MPYTFNPSRYPDVRAAIGVDIDEALLPDTMLALPIYRTEAERYINRSLTDDQQAADTAATDYAAVMYLASLVVPAVRFVDAERVAGENIVYSKIDPVALAERLRNAAAEAVAEIIALPGSSSDAANASGLNYFGVARRRDFRW